MTKVDSRHNLISALPRILVTGFIAGALDAVAAIMVYQAKATSIFRLIASGVFGQDAFSGGNEMVAFGVMFHFIIATIWTGFYFLLDSRLHFGRVNQIVMITGYGIFIWLVMNLMVLPLSNVPQRPIDATGAAKGIAILIVAVSLPIVVSANARRLRS
jgi:hypothetical protein